jgi:uroporphyrinogen decarboxylase
MAEFFIKMGYDCMCFECCISPSLPGGGCLGDEQKEPAIKTMEDFAHYPWDEIPDRFFNENSWLYDALAEALPPGLGVVGGVGNGILECVQDLTGYVNLCLMRYDDPELYQAMFSRITQLINDIWSRFLPRWGSLFTIARIGDDMGFKNSTLLPPDDLVNFVAPGYRRIIELVHRYGKPFLLHSCGNIFQVMDAFISAGIDAKHSNENAIAPLPQWLEMYGDRIAIFGGIDVDIITRATIPEVRDECKRLIEACRKFPGFAFGTGNSVPPYIPVDNYVTMIETAREMRGE